MAFAVGDPQENGMLVYEPYEMNMGISVAANLREAFKVSELLQSGYKRLLAEIDTHIHLVGFINEHTILLWVTHSKCHVVSAKSDS